MAGALEGDVFIGRKAQEFRGLLKIKYPMEHGIVTDWDDMERIWSWVYAEELGTLSEEVRLSGSIAPTASLPPLQHPVLLTEAPLNPRHNRDVAAQIFFDTFNVPALFISVQAVLSLSVRAHRLPGILNTTGLFAGIPQDGQQELYSIPVMALHMLFPYSKASLCPTPFGEST